MKRVSCVVFVTLATSVSVAHGAGMQRVWEVDGTGCKAAMGLLEVSVQTLRNYVPRRFTPISGSAETGPNVFVGGAEHCDVSRRNGRTVASPVFSSPGVLIESPDGSPGPHYYMLWYVTTTRADRRLMSRLGVPGAVITGITQTLGAVGPAATLATHVPWGARGYAVDGQAVATVPGPPQATFWHLGRRGLAKFVSVHEVESLRIGGGVVRSAPRSPLAAMAGRTAAGLAALQLFSLRVTAYWEHRR